MKLIKSQLRIMLLAATCLTAQHAEAAEKQTHIQTATGHTRLSEAVIAERADALLKQMTPEEKAGQLAVYFYLPQMKAAAASVERQIASGQVGNALFVSDAPTINRLQKIAVEQSRLRIPLLVGFDVIHGLRTIMPVPLALAASWDPALVEQTESAAAAEARAVGINWVFAPNVDIARDPRWGRIVEGAGEDPYLGSVIAAAHVRGFQGPYVGSPSHVISGPKHFAGYGASIGGRDYDEVQISDNELWNVYLPPFKAAIDAGAGNIMSAYMPLNGVPSSANPWLLTDVLRKAWGFKGFVVSDANAVLNLTTQGFTKDATDAGTRAVSAGLDMEMTDGSKPAAVSHLPDAAAAGRISQSAIDQAVRRILEAKLRLGLFEHPYVDENAVDRVLDDPRHLDLARLAAERSAVLLRNEGSLLPLDRKRLKSIAVIGPLADSDVDMLGPWTFPQNGVKANSVIAGLRAKVGKDIQILYAKGVEMPRRTIRSPFEGLYKYVKPVPFDEPTEIAHAVEAASQADVAVLALGESQLMSGESASRSSLDLPGSQQKLLDAVIATGKPVVVLLFGARPFDLKGSSPGALLDMWYPGSAGGTATANLLFGDAVPGGKLPITWVANVAHLPNPLGQLISFSEKTSTKRYWNDASNAPTYPFGFGLSYSQFAYSKLTLSAPVIKADQPVTVSVELSNTGARTGDEVAQLYIHQRYGEAARPVRELKGFQRVALRPGEKRMVRFEIRPEDRRYWSPVTKTWVADATMFDVWVGGNSAATLAGSFEVKTSD